MDEDIVPGVEPENKPVELSPIEQRAVEMGWRPKENFEGDEDDFIDAKEFVRRKPLFDRIEHQSKEVKNLHKALTAFKEHYTKVEEAAYNKAVKDLQVRQKDALKEGDVDSYYSIQEEIDAAKEQVSTAKQAIPDIPQPAEVNPVFLEWKTRNSWYDSASYMRTFADEYGTKLANQGMQPNEVLREVEKAVRKEFPNKFSNPNRDRPGLESGNTGGRAPKGDTMVLSDQERRIMNTLVTQGVITKEKYIADLKKAKGE